MAGYEMIATETQGRVAVVRLNRPQALNALCDQLMEELGQALRGFDDDPAIAAIVVTGSEKAFAAGADIKEMQGAPTGRVPGRLHRQALGSGDAGAEAGDRRGGGLRARRRLRAGDDVRHDHRRRQRPLRPAGDQPGIIPGAGGTQRLTRAVGKAKAMEMVLTGRMMDAQEAERASLVSRVVPAAEVVAEAVKVGEKIAALSAPSVAVAKEAVNRAFETTLAEGVKFERRVFHALFATEDQKEGMSAFAEKRKPAFRNR
jgi:enoyl-CoA hydratase